MAGDVEHGQAAGIQADRTATESERPARPAWAKPMVRRFSLQKTLAGSGAFSDGGGHSQVTPT
jgi:hypothetical protein